MTAACDHAVVAILITHDRRNWCDGRLQRNEVPLAGAQGYDADEDGSHGAARLCRMRHTQQVTDGDRIRTADGDCEGFNDEVGVLIHELLEKRQRKM